MGLAFGEDVGDERAGFLKEESESRNKRISLAGGNSRAPEPRPRAYSKDSRYSLTESAALTPAPTAVATCLGQASATSPAA